MLLTLCFRRATGIAHKHEMLPTPHPHPTPYSGYSKIQIYRDFEKRLSLIEGAKILRL